MATEVQTDYITDQQATISFTAMVYNMATSSVAATSETQPNFNFKVSRDTPVCP